MRGCTSIGWCKICGKPFEKIGKGTGSRKYCSKDVCALNAKRKSNRKYEHNTRFPNMSNEAKEAKLEYERTRRLLVEGKPRKIKPGTCFIVGKPNPDWTDKEWIEYHKKIKKMPPFI